MKVYPASKEQIIANHYIVDDFEKIPPIYMEKVKKMMVFFPGESHSQAYRDGMILLQSKYPEYKCNISKGEKFTDQYLRINSGISVGEAQWFTWTAYPIESRPKESNFIKNLITEYYELEHPISIIGFAWCYDDVGYSRRGRLKDIMRGDVSLKRDPVYGVHWYGFSEGGPDGDRVWGLDSTDYSLTRNRVNLNTYLKATQDYIEYCKENNYDTKVVFTTGPADRHFDRFSYILGTGQSGYQGYLKHQYIRNYVSADTSRILFDYYDILCFDDDGRTNTTKWKGHTYPVITKQNLGDGSVGHISPEGAIRLAKAQWWMLARIAGWDGN